MTIDLDKQRGYAKRFADELSADIGSDEVTADLILDLLGVCGLALREGEDAGKTWFDDIIDEVKGLSS
jgi:hypothetical protein